MGNPKGVMVIMIFIACCKWTKPTENFTKKENPQGGFIFILYFINPSLPMVDLRPKVQCQSQSSQKSNKRLCSQQGRQEASCKSPCVQPPFPFPLLLTCTFRQATIYLWAHAHTVAKREFGRYVLKLFSSWMEKVRFIHKSQRTCIQLPVNTQTSCNYTRTAGINWA